VEVGELSIPVAEIVAIARAAGAAMMGIYMTDLEVGGLDQGTHSQFPVFFSSSLVVSSPPLVPRFARGLLFGAPNDMILRSQYPSPNAPAELGRQVQGRLFPAHGRGPGGQPDHLREPARQVPNHTHVSSLL
jgi:hypothetical protein